MISWLAPELRATISREILLRVLRALPVLSVYSVELHSEPRVYPNRWVYVRYGNLTPDADVATVEAWLAPRRLMGERDSSFGRAGHARRSLRAAFNPSNGWNVAAIEPDRIQTRYHDDGAPAWFAAIKRI